MRKKAYVPLRPRKRMPRRLPAAALLLAAATVLAGCASSDPPEPAAEDTAEPLAPLSEATFGVGEFLTLKVPSYDGTLLHVDMQLPEGEGPWPTIIEYTPYSLLGEWQWGLFNERGVDDMGQAGFGTADHFVPRGYAVGVAHVRGTGESGGCLTVGGPNEGKDGYAIVEHIANQSWSDGRVAMMGTSYVGTTPIETAVLNPPHLTTIIPISAVTSWYKYYFENGEQRMNGSPPPGASYPDPALWMALGVAPGARTLATDPMDAKCVADYWQQFWLQDDYNAFWQERNHGALASQIRVPVLFAMGFDDENVATNMITDFWANVTSEKRAFFSQHSHGVPASKEAWWSYVDRWLDHWMKESPNGALQLPAAIVEDNRGVWRAEAEWPPADTTTARFWLASGAALLNDTPPEEGTVSFLDDGVGELDEATVGQTWLRFVSEPLEAPMLVAGDPRMHLVASSDMTDTQWTILVHDRAPDGTESFVTRGYLDARHRESLESGTDVNAGEALAYEWLLHPRDHYLDAGHSLVVIVKSSDPYIIPDATRATNTVHYGAQGSWIELPLAPLDGRIFAEEAPTPAAWAAP